MIPAPRARGAHDMTEGKYGHGSLSRCVGGGGDDDDDAAATAVAVDGTHATYCST